MARLVVPEFKENEEILSDTFNEVNSSLRSFSVNGENLSNEAINESHVEDQTAFGSVSSISIGNKTCLPWYKEAESFNFKYAHGHWLHASESPSGPTDTGSVTVTNISADSKILVRCSCRLVIPDVGARTFFTGNNPVVVLALRYRKNVGSAATPGSGWVSATQTQQNFQMAFSGKIASDSSGSFLTAKESGIKLTVDGEETPLEDFFSGSEYGLKGETVRSRSNTSSTTLERRKRDTTDPFQITRRDRYRPTYRKLNTLSGDFSYTTCFVLDEPADLTNAQFALWGSYYGFDPGCDSGFGSATAVQGCYKPDFDGFKIIGLQLYAYEIKK